MTVTRSSESFSHATEVRIRLITFNVYQLAGPRPYGYAWKDRCRCICRLIMAEMTGCNEAIVCLQRVPYPQLLYILQCLDELSNNIWEAVGFGSDDGRYAGEFSPILYLSDVWQPLTTHKYWFGPTTDAPSRHETAQYMTMVTMGMFRHLNIPAYICVLNTHLDRGSENVRRQSAEYLSRALIPQIRGIACDSDSSDRAMQSGLRRFVPVFLTGSFSSDTRGAAYTELTTNGGMVDLNTQVDEEHRFGGGRITHLPLQPNPEIPPPRVPQAGRVSFVFVNDQSIAQRRLPPGPEDDGGSIEVTAHDMLPDPFSDNLAALRNDRGIFTDHGAVIADVVVHTDWQDWSLQGWRDYTHFEPSEEPFP